MLVAHFYDFKQDKGNILSLKELGSMRERERGN